MSFGDQLPLLGKTVLGILCSYIEYPKKAEMFDEIRKTMFAAPYAYRFTARSRFLIPIVPTPLVVAL